MGALAASASPAVNAHPMLTMVVYLAIMFAAVTVFAVVGIRSARKRRTDR